MKKKTALLIGGTGQIGLYLSKYLLKKKYKVFITTRKVKKETLEKLHFLKIRKKYLYMLTMTLQNILKIILIIVSKIVLATKLY